MRILITNDDGVHAYGLKVLEGIARKLGGEVYVVAPESDQSGVAHSLSLNNPLRLREVGPRHFAVQGTPTDCIIMGVRRLFADARPDLILSGVNRGQNVAEDVTYSGTIAAAMEGALLGVPSIALSQSYGGARDKVEWDCAVTLGPQVVERILVAGVPEGTLVNVNFPACAAAKAAGFVVTRQGRRDTELMQIEERRDGRGIPYYWLMFKRGGFEPGVGTDIEALAGVDAVIEAVFESLALKCEVFAMLGARCKPGALLASNTSTLDIDALAAASGRPADVLGMHFFSPANIMRLVEIVRGRHSDEGAIATAREMTRRMGKLGILVGNCFGFVGNRMLYAYGRENQLLLLEGATPASVDEALERFGMAMGPNAVSDLAGLDVGYRIRRERADRPRDPRYYRAADLLVEAGRLGQKAGRGFYLYPQGSRKRVRDPEVEALIVAESQRLGVARREISETEIRERCLFALINEGARLLGEGIASSAADIDAIWCNGYGFPRFRGGPMFYADTLGLATVLEGLERYAREQGAEIWSPAPLLVELVAQGLCFSDRQTRPGATAEQPR